MAFSFMDGDGASNLSHPSKLYLALIYYVIKVLLVFFNVSSGTGWVIMQAASFLCITTPQFFLFVLETKQMENNDW